jgi:hypothetical protein
LTTTAWTPGSWGSSVKSSPRWASAFSSSVPTALLAWLSCLVVLLAATIPLIVLLNIHDYAARAWEIPSTEGNEVKVLYGLIFTLVAGAFAAVSSDVFALSFRFSSTRSKP